MPSSLFASCREMKLHFMGRGGVCWRRSCREIEAWALVALAFILFYFILFYFILFYFILFYFIL
jgi:hypothetical protein